MLPLLAGLATGIGSGIAFFAKRTNYRFLSVGMGFSAGVMLYVSFTEILAKASARLVQVYGEPGGGWATAGAFFGGILFIGLIDRLVPKHDNPHEVRAAGEVAALKTSAPGRPRPTPDAQSPMPAHRLLRTGLFTALALTIHNFPEGMVTFLAALDSPRVGAAIAVAIALHNIPEGISVAVPIFYATGRRRRAFAYSLLSGLAEPAGAVIGWLLLRNFMSPAVMGVMFGGVAGIMTFISLDELVPVSHAYGRGHDAIFGLVGGMAVMALSLLLMR